MIGQGTEAEVLIEGEEIVEVTDNLKQPVTDNQTQQDDPADSKQEAGSGQSSASPQKSTKKDFMKNRFTTYHEMMAGKSPAKKHFGSEEGKDKLKKMLLRTGEVS